MSEFGDELPSGFTDEEWELIRSVKGRPHEDLMGAYESFAEDVSKALAEHYGRELPEDFFDRRPPIPTIVHVRARTHNNWVKEYWVKAY